MKKENAPIPREEGSAQIFGAAMSAVSGVFGGISMLLASGVLFYLGLFSSASPVDVESSSVYFAAGAVLLTVSAIYCSTLLLRRLLRDSLLLDGIWLFLSSFFGMLFLQMALRYDASIFWNQQALMVFLLSGCFFVILASGLGILFH